MSKKNKNRPRLTVKNVLLTESREILLGLRSDCLKWATPGGKVGAESVVEAAIREQREETDMELKGQPLCLGFADGLSKRQTANQSRSVCIFLLWRSWRGFPQLTDDSHLAWRWFALDWLPESSKLKQSASILTADLLPNYLEQFAVGVKTATLSCQCSKNIFPTGA